MSAMDGDAAYALGAEHARQKRDALDEAVAVIERDAILAWLASQEAEKALAEALKKQHAAFLEQPESFESRQAIAAFLLSALTESVKR